MMRTLASLALLGAPLLAQGDNPRHRLLEEHVPGFVAERMIRANLPGVSVVLLTKGGVAYERSFGRKNLSLPNPISSETVFRVGSLTKQLTAIAILKLAEDRKLRLDDPVVEHLPDFCTRGTGHEKITLRHLLSHRSGLPRGPYYGTRFPSDEEQIANLGKMELAFLPGRRFKYSNAGYALLGRVVEKISGMSYRRFVQRRILAPLGMSQSGFELRSHLAGHYATGYQTDRFRSLIAAGDRLHAAPLLQTPDAASNLFASARDVARLLMCLLRGGDVGGKRLMSAASFQQMMTPYGPQPNAEGYGLALWIGKRFGRASFSHAGGTYGHSSFFVGFPEQQVGCLVLINRASAQLETMRIADRVVSTWFGESVPPQRVDRRLVGRYENDEHTVEIVARDFGLFLLDAGRSFRLEPSTPGQYLVAGGRFRGWPVDLRVRDVLSAGPIQLVRGSPAPAIAPSPWDRFCGKYHRDDYGEVVVFRRGRAIMLAMAPDDQTPLHFVDGQRFKIVGGGFDGEPAEFVLEGTRVVGLRAGYMLFKRGGI